MPAVTIELLVDQALTHGSLYNLGYGRTITVAGKRRALIRLQVEIFGRLRDRGGSSYYYPDLVPAIDTSIDAWREANRP